MLTDGENQTTTLTTQLIDGSVTKAKREDGLPMETTETGLVLTDSLTRLKLQHRSKEDLLVLMEHFYQQIQAVSEELVELLQVRHDLYEQVDMRQIAVEQLVRSQNNISVSSTSSTHSCHSSLAPLTEQSCHPPVTPLTTPSPSRQQDAR